MINPISIVSIASVFDRWFGSTVKELKENEHYMKECMDTYGFMLRVVCSIDIPPRHSEFSWIREMGVTKFDELFQGKLNRIPNNWLMAFPERHISIEEQQGLINALVKTHKKFKTELVCLDILTSSPMILSDTKSCCLKLIGFAEGKKTYNQDYMM